MLLFQLQRPLLSIEWDDDFVWRIIMNLERDGKVYLKEEERERERESERERGRAANRRTYRS
jgi:hypothetical protein